MTSSRAPGPPGPTDEPARPNAGGDLRRAVGPLDATMLVMGSIVGAGIFREPAQVAAQMGSSSGVLTLWVVGGLIALCGAVVFAELGALLPRVGGQYAFLREAFGGLVAFLFGWLLLAAVVSPAIAYVARVFARHLEIVLQAVRPEFALGDSGVRFTSILLIVLLALTNARGLVLGARIQSAAMLTKLAGILAVVALGAWAASSGARPPDVPMEELGVLKREWASRPPWAPAAFGPALLGVVFSIGGFQNVAAIATEVRRPERNLPLSILAGTVLVVLLYVGLNAACIALLGVEGLALSPTPVADAAGAAFPGGASWVALLIALSTFAITQVLLMLAPRIYYAMARDGVFFGVVGRVHPRWRTPAVAIGLQGAFAVLHACIGSELDLLRLTTLVDWSFFTLSGVALFVLRHKLPDAERPYRATGYPWLPGLFVLAGSTIVATVTWGALREPELGTAALRAVVMLALGLALYAVWSRGRARR